MCEDRDAHNMIALLKTLEPTNGTLIFLIQNGYLDLAEKLIDSGSNLNHQDSIGRYSYNYLIQQWFSFIINSLWKSRTALHLAIENGYLQLAEKLIESGANLDLQDSNGRYALKFKYIHFNLLILRYFINWYFYFLTSGGLYNWQLRTVIRSLQFIL